MVYRKYILCCNYRSFVYKYMNIEKFKPENPATYIFPFHYQMLTRKAARGLLKDVQFPGIKLYIVLEAILKIVPLYFANIIWKMCTFHKTKVMLTQPTSLLCLGSRKGRFVTNTLESKAARECETIYTHRFTERGRGWVRTYVQSCTFV